MKNFFLVLLSMTLLVIFSCTGNEPKNEAQPISQDSLIKKGDYLVRIMGCNDCHTPKNFGPNGPEPDMTKLLAGHPAGAPLPPLDSNVIKAGWITFVGDLTASAGPWGVSFAANLTSDKETGIGNWSLEQFIRAFQEGKYNGDEHGRMILPPMPWQEFSAVSPDDVKAIFAYLQSTKPVSNKVSTPMKLSQLRSR